MSEDLTALAKDVRRSAALVRDLKAESKSITSRLAEIHGGAAGLGKGQLDIAEMALEDAIKRLQGVEDEPVDPIEVAAKARYDAADKAAHPIAVESSGKLLGESTEGSGIGGNSSSEY